MVVICGANVVVRCDGKRPGLSNAPLDVEYDNNITEESTATAIPKLL